MALFVVSVVVTRLSDLLLQEAIYLIDVSDKAHELLTELTWIQYFLKDADERQNESAFVKNSVAEMKDLAYDAEDVIATYALTVASRKGRAIQKVLKRCACILDEGITMHQVGSKIDAIKTRISILKRSFQEYGIMRESIIQAGGSSSLNEQRKTYSYLEDDPVGFNDDLDKLVEILLKEEEGPRVASICGMGGLGKTTLARMVYNNPKVKQYFNGGCAWVCISQQWQKRPVWEEIMINLLPKEKSQNDRKEEIKGWSDEDLIKELRQVQQEQKCLVVLDDIWKIGDWNILCQVFPMKDTKSKILLTSRNSDVALKADPRGIIHKLECLSPEKSWELLEKMAISWRSDPVAKTYMKKFGDEMIRYCGGLPLAIVVLGGLLAMKQTWEEWQDVLQHAKSYLHVEDSQVSNVLALSYKDLPSHLKPCFLYLGHFPEDFEIQTKELIRMWMAEGFISQIQHRGGREDTMDNVGDRYLRELQQRCMVLVGKEGSLGRIKTCRMHDLMRDFCVSKAQEENFLHFTDTFSMKQHEAQISKVRRLAIISESGDYSFKGINFNKYPYLRSLLHLLSQHDESYFEEFSFKKFKLVRVLHLEYFKSHQTKLPKDIGYLIHLRYLSLKGSYLNEVPSSIGNLMCLETLDLRIKYYPPYSISVPNVFKYMKQLKHLYLPRGYRVRGKLELANLSYLQTLVNVQPNTIQIPTWFKLKRLRVLKVTNDKLAQDALEIPISRCPHIEKLNLRSHIKKLPDAHQFSPNLAKLTLWETHLEEDPMPTLEKLPNLKILRLLDYSFKGKDMVCSEGGFPLLQYLLLEKLLSFKKWDVKKGAMPSLCRLKIFCLPVETWKVEKEAMPSLCHLKIENCRQLGMIPDGLRFVTTLQELEIHGMRKSFKDRLDEGGPDFDKVKHVSSLVFQDCDGDWL